MVLLIDATGRVDSVVARALMASKAPFRVLVRRPENVVLDCDTEVEIPCFLF